MVTGRRVRVDVQENTTAAADARSHCRRTKQADEDAGSTPGLPSRRGERGADLLCDRGECGRIVHRDFSEDLAIDLDA